MTEDARGLPRRADPVLWGGLLLGALLLLWNLGRDALWTDEAESMLLARSILEHGLPVAYDGENLISQATVARRADFDDDLVWILTPWAQLYLGAASFALLGVSDWSARLPFALVGLGTLALLYRVTRRISGERGAARAALLLALGSVAFLLHARQARYYPLAMLATLWALDAYLTVVTETGRRAGRAGWSLVLALGLLFHTNYGQFLPVAAGLALHALGHARGRVAWGRALRIAGATALLTLPWALYAGIHRTSVRTELGNLVPNALQYLHAINAFALPGVVALAGGLAAWRLRASRSPRRGDAVRSAGLGAIAAVSALQLLLVSANAGYFTRYVINLVPLWLAVQGLAWSRVAAWARLRAGTAAALGAWALFGVALLTNLPAWPLEPLLRRGAVGYQEAAPGERGASTPPFRRLDPWRSDLWELLHELAVDVRGPVEGAVAFLAPRVEPGDLVFSPWGYLPLMHYLEGVEVRGLRQGVPFTGEPDWVVSRGALRGGNQDALRARLLAWGYLPVALPDVPDTRWQNRPEPYLHRYRTAPLRAARDPEPDSVPPVLIFMHPRKRLGAADGLLLGSEALASQTWGVR